MQLKNKIVLLIISAMILIPYGLGSMTYATVERTYVNLHFCSIKPLPKVDWGNCYLVHDLHNVNLSGVNLSGLVAKNVEFYNVNLVNASLKNASLAGIDFAYSNLAGADLRGANLRWADFYHANLAGADLRGRSEERRVGKECRSG